MGEGEEGRAEGGCVFFIISGIMEKYGDKVD
jgi:hypothetical protein